MNNATVITTYAEVKLENPEVEHLDIVRIVSNKVGIGFVDICLIMQADALSRLETK